MNDGGGEMGTQWGEEASEKSGGTQRAREEEDYWPRSLQVLVGPVRAALSQPLWAAQ